MSKLTIEYDENITSIIDRIDKLIESRRDYIKKISKKEYDKQVKKGKSRRGLSIPRIERFHVIQDLILKELKDKKAQIISVAIPVKITLRNH